MLDRTILLADDDGDRRQVLEEFLNEMEYSVVSCASVEDCANALISRIWPPAAFLGSSWLNGELLLPILQQYCGDDAMVFKPLCLWSLNGAEDLLEHVGFLALQRALVFPLPLDVMLMQQVMRLFDSAEIGVHNNGEVDIARNSWRIVQPDTSRLRWVACQRDARLFSGG